MEQSPLEADSFAASQAIPSILRNLEVCYLFLLLPILSKNNLAHTHPSHLRTVLKLPLHPCQGLDNGTNTWKLPCQFRACAVHKCILIKYKNFFQAEGYFQPIVAIFVDLIEIRGYSLIKHCMYPTMPVLVAARSKVWVCSHSPAEIVGSNPAGGAQMFVCYKCCVLSGRGLCDKSYWLWCIIVCDLETSRTRRPWPSLGCNATCKFTHVVAILVYTSRSHPCIAVNLVLNFHKHLSTFLCIY